MKFSQFKVWNISYSKDGYFTWLILQVYMLWILNRSLCVRFSGMYIVCMYTVQETDNSYTDKKEGLQRKLNHEYLWEKENARKRN